MRAAVVGAGISGAACARELARAGHEVVVLDRGRRPGGRMASRTLHGRTVDLGAGYFTVSDPGFAVVVADWTRRGLALPWTDTFGTATPAGRGADRPGPVRHRAPGGLRSLVEDLAEGLDVRSGHDVARIGPGPQVDGEAYDVVVLAMPDPQALRLLDDSHPAARQALTGRPWDAVIAVAAGWPERSWDLDAVFVNDSPVLSFVADDGRRRGDLAPVLVAHTASTLAARHLDAPDTVVPEVVAALRELLDVPEPAWTAVQRWTYAKPRGDREQPYGRYGRLGLCGDGWGRSKVETAWRSGALLGRALASDTGLDTGPDAGPDA